LELSWSFWLGSHDVFFVVFLGVCMLLSFFVDSGGGGMWSASAVVRGVVWGAKVVLVRVGCRGSGCDVDIRGGLWRSRGMAWRGL